MKEKARILREQRNNQVQNRRQENKMTEVAPQPIIEQDDKSVPLDLNGVAKLTDGAFEGYLILDKGNNIIEVIIYQFGMVGTDNFIIKDGNIQIKGTYTGNQLLLTQRSAHQQGGGKTINVNAVKEHQINNLYILKPLTKYYQDDLFELINEESDEILDLNDITEEVKLLSVVDEPKHRTIPKTQNHGFVQRQKDDIDTVDVDVNTEKWVSIFPFQCAVRKPYNIWIRTHAEILFEALIEAEREGKQMIAYCNNKNQCEFLYKIFPHIMIFSGPISTMKGHEIEEFTKDMDVTIALLGLKRGGEVPVSYNFIDVTEQKVSEQTRYGLRAIDLIKPDNDYALTLIGSDSM